MTRKGNAMLDLAPGRGDLDPIEIASRDEIAALQLDRLKQTLRRAYDVPHYRAKCDAAGVAPAECRSLDDLARFPFTTKDDLRGAYPFGMSRFRTIRSLASTLPPAPPASRPWSPTPGPTSTSGRT